MRLSEYTDMKNELFAEMDQEFTVTLKVKYVAYHREKLHQVEIVPSPEVIGLASIKEILVHESRLNEAPESSPLALSHLSANLESAPEMQHKPLSRCQAVNDQLNDVWAVPAFLGAR